MPGNKPSKRGESEGRKPRKQRAHGFARRRMEPTRRVIHAAESCPECGTGLTGGWVHRTREVIELPLPPAEVVEQVFMARMCALCGQRWLPRDQLKGLVVGRQRFGVNLVSLIVTLREEGRLPIRSIQQYLQTVHQLKLSVGAIVDTIHRVARQAQPVVAEMVDRIRGSPVVHADETGWRQDGVNGYVWTFSTPTDRYFLRRGRGKEVVDEALGDSFDGVLVSDFYAAYNHYPRPQAAVLGTTCCGTSVIWRRCTLMTLACLVGLERCANSTTRPRPALPLPTVRRPAISSQCHPTNWRWRDGCCRCATPSPTTRACLMPSSVDA